jgi:hypothetical protein
MNIKKIIREEVEDFEWITNENNPWENIPQQDMDQLTEREKKLINNIFEEEDYWQRYHGCQPRFQITNLDFDEYDEWWGGVNRGVKRKINLYFNSICDNDDSELGKESYLCATIDRDTLDYSVA